MRISLRSIPTDFNGFLWLARLEDRLKRTLHKQFLLNMEKVEKLDGNMCAPLGAILHPLRQRGKITLSGMRSELRSVISVNGFLHNFGFKNVVRESDTQGTTIEYQRFEPTGHTAFVDYLTRHFVGKGIPTMSDALHRKFRESIAELFCNAVDHSNSSMGIFACGQFYREENRLEFSIADRGIGMRENILRKKGLNLTANDAICWAVKEGNTTRTLADGRPGGLGLKLICEFIELNQGKIIIVSDSGFWCRCDRIDICKTLPYKFPGTVVNIEINTADTKSYRLKNEIDPTKVF